MAQQTRNPTSDTSVTGTWSGSASSRYTLVDDYPDQGTDTLTLTGFSGGEIDFGFSAFTVPGGSIINYVAVQYYDATPSDGLTPQAGARLSTEEETPHVLITNPTFREARWYKNPSDNLLWTVSSVNALTSFGIHSPNANPGVTVYSIQIIVDYTPPPVRDQVFLETLLRNTVWTKLSLYDFEQESAGALSTIAEKTGQYAQNDEASDYRDFVGQTGEKAEVAPFGLNGRNVLRFKSTTTTRYIKTVETGGISPNVTFAEAVVVCKYDGALFTGGDPVLLSNHGSGATLKGDDTTDDFLTTATTYQRDWQTTTGTPAPMNEWGVVRISGSFNFLEGSNQITIGDSFDGTGEEWKGDIAEIMLFTSALTSTERKQVKFYNQLKWGLLGMSTVNFPDPTITGIDYARYYEVPADYSEVTYTNDYEDGGRSFNQSGTPPKRWEIEFTGLDPDEAEIFDIFHDLVKMVGTFDFTDPASVTYSDVRVESYERNHTGHRSWINTVRFTLTQYPV